MSVETERIKELESRIKDIQSAIESSPKVVGTIVAGPLEEGNRIVFRVSYNGSEAVLPLISDDETQPKLNDEVLIVENKIVGIINKELEKRTNTNVLYYKLSTWDDIIGLDNVLEDIKTSIKTLSIGDLLFEEFGVKPVKGILLYGPPGNGKTLIGKAIASDILNSDLISENQFIFIKGGEMLDKYVGETEHKISQAFKRARDYTRSTGEKAVIFIDEADAILGKRGYSTMASTIVPTFLSEMDGLEGDAPFILLSTNLPSSLDEAVVRDGRIDQKIEIPNPDIEGAEKIFIYYINKVKCDECAKIAKKASELLFEIVPKNKISGAMINNIVNLSAKTAAIRYSLNPKSIKAVCWEDVESCINKLK